MLKLLVTLKEYTSPFEYQSKIFQIADRSKLLTPMKGYWDVHAAVVQDTLAVNEEGEHGINLGYTF